MLIFSPSPIETVRVKINIEDWIEGHNIKGPLFVAKWNPQKYSSGLHQITVRSDWTDTLLDIESLDFNENLCLKVYARDRNGRASEIDQHFALDGSRMHFRLLPRMALMMDATYVVSSVF